MSVRPHPTKDPGWWVIDYYPNGKKGKQKKMAFPGTREEAEFYEQELRLEARGNVSIGPLPRVNQVIPEFMS